MPIADPAHMPAPHMGEEPRWNGRWRLPLLGRRGALGKPVVEAALEIDERATVAAVGRGAGDRAGPRPGVERD